MAAGQGFKTFVTGEVLTAGDVNGYLMQGINVFASTAARDAAITAPAEGQFAFTKDTNGLWYYDGAAWVASGATGDIEGVTAGIGISGGGTSGTVTITNSMATAIDAKGDLVVGTGADTFSRLAVGSNNQVLTADSTTATGTKWAAPSAAATTYTLVSTTTLSGSSTTISGLGAYDNYIFEFNCISGGFGQIGMKFNGGTGSTLNYAGQKLQNTSASASYHIGDGMNVNGTPDLVIVDGFGSGINVSGFAQINAASTTSRKFIQLSGDGADTPANNQKAYSWKGMWNPAATLSSVAFYGNGITITGTVRTYGA